MVPVAAIVPEALFNDLWTGLMLVALWWLAGRDVLRALALVAFPPVAVEFWFRNVHLFLAVFVVLGLRRWSGSLAIGAASRSRRASGSRISPCDRRWREAAIAAAVGLAMLVVSFALSPQAWRAYSTSAFTGVDPLQQSAFVDMPFPIRAVAGVVVTSSRRGCPGDR